MRPTREVEANEAAHAVGVGERDGLQAVCACPRDQVLGRADTGVERIRGMTVEGDEHGTSPRCLHERVQGCRGKGEGDESRKEVRVYYKYCKYVKQMNACIPIGEVKVKGKNADGVDS